MKVVLTAPINPRGLEILREVARPVILAQGTAEELAAEIRDADGVLFRGSLGCPAELIHSAPRLKVIGRYGVGYDNVDVAAATAAGIPVVITPGANTETVAEQAWALLLALARRLPFWHRAVLEGRWNCRYTEESIPVRGKMLGIVGLGRIGRRVARLARAFEARVQAYDPYLTPAEAADVPLVDLETLLRTSDFISLHCLLSEETRRLIDREAVGKMKPGAIVVNTARGAVCDLDALAEGLQSGHLAGVGLDVFPEQPPDLSHPIFRQENFLCSPHVSSLTPDADEKIATMVCSDIVRVLRGERPHHPVNPEAVGSSARLSSPSKPPTSPSNRGTSRCNGENGSTGGESL
jgi:D-3-phosphoglycerate dehydrogenase